MWPMVFRSCAGCGVTDRSSIPSDRFSTIMRKGTIPQQPRSCRRPERATTFGSRSEPGSFSPWTKWSDWNVRSIGRTARLPPVER